MNNNKSKITRDMLISEVMKKNILVPAILGKFGMYCQNCDSRFDESLEEAAKLHNADISQLLYELNMLVK